MDNPISLTRPSSGKQYQLAWWPLARCARDARVAKVSVYVAVLAENENVRPVKSKDRIMVYPLFAANPERGRRNHVTVFCFALVLLALFFVN
jgi:hypothetical protein